MKKLLQSTSNRFAQAVVFLFILYAHGLYGQYDRVGTTIKALYEGKIDDGPYIEIVQKKLIVSTIKDEKVEQYERPLKTVQTTFRPEPAVYKGVTKVVAFSDLHGQYDLSLELLEKNKVIDKNGNWSFGNGHLVIVGDVFDRGDKVTDLLWFIFYLEQQASQQNGKVHFLLGNHEYMIFQEDLRHINKKYKMTSALLNTSYTDLFGKNTVLGRWLRSKATVIKINDILFVHWGISPEFESEAKNLRRVNTNMRKSIDVAIDAAIFQEKYVKYHLDDGPIWYRGYFQDTLSKNDIDTILKKLKVNHIVVGHTTQKNVESLYDNEIFAVDSGIKNGEKGQLLFIENGVFSKATLKGNRKKVQ